MTNDPAQPLPLEELRKRAETAVAANCYPDSAEPYGDNNEEVVIGVDLQDYAYGYSVAMINTGDPEAAAALAEYWIRANPAAILALLDRLAVAESREAMCHCGSPMHMHGIDDGHAPVELPEVCPYLQAKDAAEAERQQSFNAAVEWQDECKKLKHYNALKESTEIKYLQAQLAASEKRAGLLDKFLSDIITAVHIELPLPPSVMHAAQMAHAYLLHPEAFDKALAPSPSEAAKQEGAI